MDPAGSAQSEPALVTGVEPEELWQEAEGRGEPTPVAPAGLAEGGATAGRSAASSSGTFMPGSSCPQCMGTGLVPTTRPCRNCNGIGYCATERGNRFVCSICDGQGRDSISGRVECPACRGTGTAPRASTAEGGATGSDSTGNGKTGDRVEWQPSRGLVIDLTLNSACLVNTIGLLLFLVALASMMARVFVLAALMFLAGLVCLAFAFLRRLRTQVARAAAAKPAAVGAEAGMALPPVEVQEEPSIGGLPDKEATALVNCDQGISIATATLIPNVLLLSFFSDMGIGTEVFSAVAPGTMFVLGGLSLALALLLVAAILVFDWPNWGENAKVTSTAVPFCLTVLASVLMSRSYSWAPLLTVLFLIPFSLGLVRTSTCRFVERASFYKAVSISMGTCASLILLAWILWILIGDHQWNQETRLRLADESHHIFEQYVYNGYPLNYTQHCGPDKNVSGFNVELRSDVSDACSTAATIVFLVYASPFIAFFCNMVMACFCFLEGVVLNVKDITTFQNALKQFVLTLVLVLAGIYACVNISSASFRLGSTMMAFLATAFAMLLVWVYLEIGDQEIIHIASQSEFTQMLTKAWASDWSRAVLVGVFSLLIPIGFALNILNMKVRRYRGRTTSQDLCTPTGRKILDKLSTWNWASVLSKVNMLWEFFFVMQIGVARLTNILLSWLNTELEEYTYGASITLVIIVGFVMFLLPPVPGVPVYVFAGIVIAEQGRSTPGVGFEGGICIAIVLGFILKLVASVGQYMIGFLLGKSLRVQHLIGVDQVPTRAIEQILNEKGLTSGKVAVLVGGPDWPTSVTCGILRMNIPQMVLGTCPIILVVAPCVLAGAFLSRVTRGEDSMWNILADAAIGLAVAVNVASFMLATYRVLNVVNRDGAELAKPRQEHEAVAELTRRGQVRNKVYQEVTAWETLGNFWKALLLVATSLQLLSGFIFVMAAEACFRDFSINSVIGDPIPDGLDGKWWKIVREPFGWVPIGIFVAAVVLHMAFVQSMECKTRERLKGSAVVA